MESQAPVPSDRSCDASPELTEFLLSLGATPEQIAAASERSGLIGLGADLVFTAADGLTARDLATRSGAPVEEVLGIWEALGVGVPGPDAPMFSAADVGLIQTLSSVELFSDAESHELLHVIGGALSRVADAAISFYVQTVESDMADSGADTLQLARKGSMAAQTALAMGDRPRCGLHPPHARRGRPPAAGPGQRE